MSLAIITTKDGSHSLYEQRLGETYHSVHGAVQESRHVFIQNGLACAFKNRDAEISILEVGFGTGLNALLTLQWAGDCRRKVNYTTLEPFPIAEDLWSKLNYPALLNDHEHYRSLHISAWGIAIPLTDYFTLLKITAKLEDTAFREEGFDLVYYDAFAPSKQPELWDIQPLKKIVDVMNVGGMFVTYCAKGQLKRDLRALDLEVQTLEGPPGKKEMVRARKIRN